jgi:hypothetical protein
MQANAATMASEVGQSIGSSRGMHPWDGVTLYSNPSGRTLARNPPILVCSASVRHTPSRHSYPSGVRSRQVPLNRCLSNAHTPPKVLWQPSTVQCA